MAFSHQKVFFGSLFAAAAHALKTMGAIERFLGGETGMTGVLHTHNRRLDFHPHVHFVVPAGRIDRKNRFWKRTRDGEFLFPQKALARVFRARLVVLLRKEGLVMPEVFRKGDWVVDCKNVGTREPALKYLSRYLYRGVISEKRIIRCENGRVTFVYRESRTGKLLERTLPGEDSLWLVLQHVLPRGFRRVRDYGFLHGNPRKLLRLIQFLLGAKAAPLREARRPAFICQGCGAEMVVMPGGPVSRRRSRSPPEIRAV